MAGGGIRIRLPRLIPVVRPAGSELEVMCSGGSQQWGRRQLACDNLSPLSSPRPCPAVSDGRLRASSAPQLVPRPWPLLALTVVCHSLLVASGSSGNSANAVDPASCGVFAPDLPGSALDPVDPR